MGQVPHMSARIGGTRCDGCPSLEVLVRRRRSGESERYWCDLLHGYIDPHAVRCPRKGE